jgi:hypothetical protein
VPRPKRWRNPASTHASSHCARTSRCRRSCPTFSWYVRPVRRFRYSNHSPDPPTQNANVTARATRPDPDDTHTVTHVNATSATIGWA